MNEHLPPHERDKRKNVLLFTSTILFLLHLFILSPTLASADTCLRPTPASTNATSSPPTLNIAIVVYGPAFELCTTPSASNSRLPYSNTSTTTSNQTFDDSSSRSQTSPSPTCIFNNPYRLPSNPLLFNYSHHFYATQFYQSWIMYEEMLKKIHDGSIPLRDGRNMTLNVTYFSVGPLDDPRVLQRSVYLADQLARPLGNSSFLPPDRHFSFVFSPVVGSYETTPPFMSACEKTRACIALVPAMALIDLWMCRGDPLPPDCIQRKRQPQTRRFDYSLSGFADPTEVVGTHIDLFRSRGLRKHWILGEFASDDVIEHTQDMMFQRRMAVLGSVILDANNSLAHTNWTVQTLSEQIISDNPDVLFIFAGSFRYPIVPFIDLLQYFEKVKFTPKSIVFAGGFEYALQTHHVVNIDYTLGSIPTLSELHGLSYRAKNIPGTNFEMFSSNATHDSPAIFKDAYIQRWGIPPFGISGFIWPSLGVTSMLITQKLVEAALSVEIEDLRLAALSISVPSVYSRIIFDVYGRLGMTDHVIVQHMPDVSNTSIDAATNLTPLEDTTAGNDGDGDDSVWSNLRLLSPAYLSSPFIYPIPTIDERNFSPKYYPTFEERFLQGMTCVCILYLFGWCVYLYRNYEEPIIRASIPSFLIFVLIGAAISVSTNFTYSSQYVTVASCTARIWLWSTGMTLAFASLFSKVWRLYLIWKSNVLLTSRKKNHHTRLLVFIAALCFIVCLINIIWVTINPVRVELIVPDSTRPVHNYYQCNETSLSLIFNYLHLSIAIALLFYGLILTYLVRNISTQYNEASSLIACVYNASICFIIVVPLMSYFNRKVRDQGKAMMDAINNGGEGSDGTGALDTDNDGISSSIESNRSNRLIYIQLCGWSFIFIAFSTVTIMLLPRWNALRLSRKYQQENKMRNRKHTSHNEMNGDRHGNNTHPNNPNQQEISTSDTPPPHQQYNNGSRHGEKGIEMYPYQNRHHHHSAGAGSRGSRGRISSLDPKSLQHEMGGGGRRSSLYEDYDPKRDGFDGIGGGGEEAGKRNHQKNVKLPPSIDVGGSGSGSSGAHSHHSLADSSSSTKLAATDLTPTHLVYTHPPSAATTVPTTPLNASPSSSPEPISSTSSSSPSHTPSQTPTPRATPATPSKTTPSSKPRRLSSSKKQRAMDLLDRIPATPDVSFEDSLEGSERYMDVLRQVKEASASQNQAMAQMQKRMKLNAATAAAALNASAPQDASIFRTSIPLPPYVSVSPTSPLSPSATSSSSAFPHDVMPLPVITHHARSPLHLASIRRRHHHSGSNNSSNSLLLSSINSSNVSGTLASITHHHHHHHHAPVSMLAIPEPIPELASTEEISPASTPNTTSITMTPMSDAAGLTTAAGLPQVYPIVDPAPSKQEIQEALSLLARAGWKVAR